LSANIWAWISVDSLGLMLHVEDWLSVWYFKK
jgi:hypothetical protein